jgi:hypothetical protein
MDDAPRCPRCDSQDVIWVVYGLPSEEMVEESIAGWVALGGCAVWHGCPDHACQHCGHEWREAPPEEAKL